LRYASSRSEQEEEVGGGAGFGHASGAPARHHYGDAYLSRVREETGKELMERGLGGYVVVPVELQPLKTNAPWIAAVVMFFFLLLAVCWVYWESLPGEGF
jgi:hypothetical protein